MRSNELPKGTRVMLTPVAGVSPLPRIGVVVDGFKNRISRCIQLVETNGYHPDVGDTYVDEVTHVMHPDPAIPGTYNTEPLELTPDHQKKMTGVRQALSAMGW